MLRQRLRPLMTEELCKTAQTGTTGSFGGVSGTSSDIVMIEIEIDRPIVLGVLSTLTIPVSVVLEGRTTCHSLTDFTD
jgi:hypothetical protein